MDSGYVFQIVDTGIGIVPEEIPKALSRFGQIVGHVLAARTAGSACGPWRLGNSPALSIALSNAFLNHLGLASLVTQPAT